MYRDSRSIQSIELTSQTSKADLRCIYIYFVTYRLTVHVTMLPNSSTEMSTRITLLCFAMRILSESMTHIRAQEIIFGQNESVGYVFVRASEPLMMDFIR